MLHRLFKKNLKMDYYDLVAKMHVNELKHYLKVLGLKISGNKNELVARFYFFVFLFAMENNIMQVKTAVEVEENLKKEYENEKLRVDNRLAPDMGD